MLLFSSVKRKKLRSFEPNCRNLIQKRWAEDILNLRNTLLQTELERKRMAFKLEEEKNAQVEREKMVQQQAKKIENLSSMVLYSNRDENEKSLLKSVRRRGRRPPVPTQELKTSLQFCLHTLPTFYLEQLEMATQNN